ncbi:STAS domain-containing protein [Actinoplanes sp. NPDC051346]|uniref:STAS domain-containing protein n=1 Tax=Actinoplanes sp. NPDC051346 TaxID=3155048 RepID=UPI00342320E3
MTDIADGGARLHVAMSFDVDRITFTLTGELDRISGQPLAELLDTATDGSIGCIDVDITQLSFVDLAGLRVLLLAYRRGARRGVVLRLRDPQPHILRLLQATDTAALLLGDGGTPSCSPVTQHRPTPTPDVSQEPRQPDPADTPGCLARGAERDQRADERDWRADERDQRADERDQRADERDRRADQREEEIGDRELLARERDRMVDERQHRVSEHQRWEDIREDLANTRERDLERRERDC